MSADFFTACERLLSATANGVYQGQDLFDQAPHVGIVRHVIDAGAVPASPDQAGQSELGEVL